VLLDGLRRLEYRGYDSAGVAVVGNGRHRAAAQRRQARANLEAVIDGEPVDGEYGVGHTRWATHGRPTEENAHPHRDCTGKIVVVHNGIIENYLELKRELQQQGHQFVTETDTEIVAHLVEREMRTTASRTPCGARWAPARAVRAGADLGRRPRQDRRRAQRPARSSWAGRRTSSSSPPTSRHPEPHARRRLPRRRGDGGRHARGRRVHRLRRPPVSKATQRVLWDPMMAEKVRLQALHAQGDLRAAAAARETILGRVSLEQGRVFLEEVNLDADDAARTWSASRSSPAARRGTPGSSAST
jgi:glutamine---fructose-6-phosphate transaminase (isomerizing)